VLRDFYVARMDVLVCRDEVISQDGGEELGGLDRVLFGENVCCLLLGVGSDDDRVVGFCIAEIFVLACG
jgi:hypothetical protein